MYGWDGADLIVRTGISTPWREVPGARMAYVEGDESAYVYVCDGHQSGNAGLLAEAIRADGLVNSFYPAIVAAESATLRRSFYGYVDGVDGEVFCDPNGDTPNGDVVDRARECVIAFVDVDE